MARIVIAEFIDEAAVTRLSGRADTYYDPQLVDTPDDLRAALRDAQALIVRNRTQVTAELLAAAPDLRCVGRLGVGLDNIDLDAASARGVRVHPATGANDDSVAEYVVMAALALLRPAFSLTARVIAGGWPRAAAIGRELAGKRAGMIGFGGTARAAAARLKALGMEVAASDFLLPADHPAWAGVRRLALGDLLAGADLISLHVPLTKDTRHLIDAAALARMKPSAVLVNAARGGVVDEAALVAALKAERLAGAALDVFEHEPLDAEIGAGFRDVPNLLLTPHIAGVTEESNVRVSALIADLVLRELGLS